MAVTVLPGSDLISTRLPWLSCPPLRAFADHFSQVGRRSNLEGPGLDARMLRYQLDGMIQISRFEHKNPAQLLFRFGVRAVCDRHLAILPTQGRCGVGALKRFAARKMAVLPQPI